MPRARGEHVARLFALAALSVESGLPLTRRQRSLVLLMRLQQD